MLSCAYWLPTVKKEPNVPEADARAQAVARLTGSDGPFLVGPATIDGVDQMVYLNAPDSLRDVLVTGARWGDRRAITYEDESRTWAEHMNLVARFAAILVERYGIRKGDRVAIAMRNYPEWIAAFAAAACVGAVCVPLNSWWSTAELVRAIADCEAAVLVADRERTQGVQAQRARLPSLRAVVEVRPGAAVSGDAAWTALLAAQTREFDLASVPIGPDDDATIMYTSGTTGQAKGAVATNRAHLTTMMNMRLHGVVEAELAGSGGERPAAPPELPATLIPGPLFHVTYLPKAIAAAVTGVHLVLMYKWDARRAVELIERESVDGFTGVPAVVRQLLDEAGSGGVKLASLRSLTTGGAQSTTALIGRIATQFQSRVTSGTGYGLTETTGAMVMIGSRDYFERPLAVGRPFPTSQVRIVDGDGRDVGTDEVGETWFKGPNVARGYWNRDTGAFTADGWFRSGDLVRRDADGFCYIVDRIKDIVIRAGENVYSSEVEEVLGSHPAVADIAVLGVPHELWGEEVAAVVQTRPHATVTADELRQHALTRLARFKIPTRFLFQRQALPRNAAGKVLKRELRSQFDSSAVGVTGQ